MSNICCNVRQPIPKKVTYGSILTLNFGNGIEKHYEIKLCDFYD